MQRESIFKTKIKFKKYQCIFYIGLFIGRLKRRIKKSKHRRYVLDQWLTTEENFHKDLETAIEYIKKPMLARQLIDKQGVNLLFPEFEGMLELSNLMISTVSIIRKQKNPNFIMIGDQLIHFATFYKLYGTYFGNRLRSQQLLKKLSEECPKDMREIEDKLKSYLKSIDIKKENMSISDCLQQPQYRMFKYVLLMKDYLKKLPKIHKDYASFSKALVMFEQINLSNNELMARLEAQEKKVKLDRLFGKTIGNSSDYLLQMSADSLYFPVKLYIFNNLVIIAAISSTLGFIEERRYINLYLNQFSFIHAKPDAKYYKNVLLLCGQYQSMHCFLPDPGERQEIITSIGKVIKELQVKAKTRRQQRAGLNEVAGQKLTFAIETTKNTVFASEFRVQVLKVEIRPFSTFTNDTVYLTRFMGPVYIEDDEAVGGGETRELGQAQGVNGLWQLTEIHLSQVMQLLKQLREQYPQIQFPEIDPLTKQINAFTEGKKNTKTFEVRAYLFEQFFNFLFRHPTITLQPFKWISKYKIVSSFLQYLCKKNDYISGRDERKEPGYRYGEGHCKLCKIMVSSSVPQLEGYRLEFAGKKRNDQCFNAFNLARMRACRLPLTAFDTLERILLRQMFESGRLDYALMPYEELHKKYQEVNVNYCNGARKITATSDYRRKVGQILLDLGFALGVQNILDYRLVLQTEDYERLLDQDEIFFDLLKKYEIEATEKEDNSKNARQTYNETSLKEEEGFFSFIVNTFSYKSNNTIALKKILFLTKQLEIKSMEKNPKRGLLLIEELFGRLLLGQIPLQVEDWAQVSALWLIINFWGKLQANNPNESLSIVFKRIMPLDKKEMIKTKPFLKIYLDTYNEFTNKLSQKLSEKQMIELFKRCLRVFYRSQRTYTYLIPATPKIIPESLITDGLGPIMDQCYLGVNYKELVVFRSKNSPMAAVRLALEDLRVTNTTFSIFIEYSYFLSDPTHSSLKSGELSKSDLRFDARVAFHFDSLFRVYSNLKRIFPQLMA